MVPRARRKTTADFRDPISISVDSGFPRVGVRTGTGQRLAGTFSAPASDRDTSLAGRHHARRRACLRDPALEPSHSVYKPLKGPGVGLPIGNPLEALPDEIGRLGAAATGCRYATSCQQPSPCNTAGRDILPLRKNIEVSLSDTGRYSRHRFLSHTGGRASDESTGRCGAVRLWQGQHV